MLAARLFDVSRMCLASDSISDDIGLSLSPCALHFKSVTAQPANERGRRTREVQREKGEGGLSFNTVSSPNYLVYHQAGTLGSKLLSAVFLLFTRKVAKPRFCVWLCVSVCMFMCECMCVCQDKMQDRSRRRSSV